MLSAVVRSDIQSGCHGVSTRKLTEIGRLFRAKLRQLREQERATADIRRRPSLVSRRRAQLEAVENEPAEDQLLRAIEVARLLNVSPKTIGRWAANQGLPCICTVGGQRRYYWADVAAWIDRDD
jgi:excisionase family DNA binding protein